MKVKCQIKEFQKDASQARVFYLFDVRSNIAIDSSITHKNKSENNDLIANDERTLALQHLYDCTLDDLTINYSSFKQPKL